MLKTYHYLKGQNSDERSGSTRSYFSRFGIGFLVFGLLLESNSITFWITSAFENTNQTPLPFVSWGRTEIFSQYNQFIPKDRITWRMSTRRCCFYFIIFL